MQQTHHSNMSSVHAHILIIVGITTRLENMLKKLIVKAINGVHHLRKKRYRNTLKLSITLRFPGKRIRAIVICSSRKEKRKKRKASSRSPQHF